MKPVQQTRFGREGNCHAAALASIFELPLETIPDFGRDNQWYIRFCEWMVQRLNLKPLDVMVESLHGAEWLPHGYHLINGKSPRGYQHSVVGLSGEMVHDPHPEGGGVVPETYTLFVAAAKPQG